MDDSISRQAAIDALCDNCDNAQSVCPHYPCKQYTAIEALPNLQQTCNQFATDLQLPLDKAQLSTEKVQLSTEKTQLSEGDRVFDSISRQAAIEIVRVRCARIPTMAIRAMMEIKDLPSIQPKRGRWKGEGLGDYRCSLCGEVNTRTRTNYCPNCGADMRGGEDEQN